MSEHLKHIAAPSASLAVQSDSRSKVLNLRGHGTWANTNLSEIIQDLVDALSPLQIISKGQEERVAALEAVKKTAQVHTDLDNESDRKQLRVDTVAMASHTQEALAARVLAVKSLLHLQVRLRAESRDGEADWVAFYRCAKRPWSRSFHEQETDLFSMVAPCRAAISATVRSATCNTFSSQNHAEIGFAKTGVLMKTLQILGQQCHGANRDLQHLQLAGSR